MDDAKYSVCIVMCIGNLYKTQFITIMRDIPKGICGPWIKIRSKCPLDGDAYATVADALLVKGFVRVGEWSHHVNGTFCDLARVEVPAAF